MHVYIRCISLTITCRPGLVFGNNTHVNVSFIAHFVQISLLKAYAVMTLIEPNFAYTFFVFFQSVTVKDILF